MNSQLQQTQNTELTQVQEVPSEFAAMQLRVEIDSTIATARAFPRSLQKFRDKALSMATFSEETAAACTYALPRGGTRLEGPSIRLAEIIAASYTNIQYGGRVISNDGKTLVAQGVCIDLENNVKATVEVNRKITDKNGKKYNQDMIVMTGNAAIAIAVRNAIFKVIPAALVSDIHDKAKEVARGTAETLNARRDKAVAYFKSIGVTEKQLCDTLGIQKVGDIDLDKLEALTGFKAAIKNGESNAKDIFSPEPTATDKVDYDTLNMLYEMKLEALPEEEKANAKRIIDNKEEKSYAKLFKQLQAL